ncbi:MAG: aldo/keto reductase [Clostridia bacterium]|nr:aldo/keto reductase [Clostridia bacterium]
MFENVKRNLGFGCMRLPMKGDEVDNAEFCRMIDRFIEGGFNYFDTAHGYLNGKSERALRECLTSRYERDRYVLADKLSDWLFKTEEDVRPFFEKQLTICGVDYFDFYLFHALSRHSYQKHKDCHTFEIVDELKREGKIKHIAMSFHDTADVLDMILSEQPQIEVVQLQINYLDYDDPGVQSKRCYDVAVKHGNKVMVMEPVKGGALVNLPPQAVEEFEKLGEAPPVSYALRYAASFPEVFMVLSGMGNVDMIESNMRFMHPFVPLNEQESSATDRAREIIRRYNQIPCTKCKYCADVCPKQIPIFDLFAVYNDYALARTTLGETRQKLASFEPKASDCIACGKCETVCPQSIDIRAKLKMLENDDD